MNMVILILKLLTEYAKNFKKMKGRSDFNSCMVYDY